MCAAITASEAGAKVVVLESAPKPMRGGNTRHTRNLRAMHPVPTSTMTESYSEEEYWEDLLRVTGGETNEALARMMIRKSVDLLHWLDQHGVHFQPSLSGSLSLGRTNAFFMGGGRALLNALYGTAQKLGVQAWYDTEVQSLKIQAGRFQSAQFIHEGVQQDITADKIIVASGGFQANIDWMKEAWGDAAENFLIRGTPYNRGRMLKALMTQGMKVIGDPSQGHAVAIDARAPKFDGGISTRLDCVCFGIVVNRHAQRFYDEGEDFWPKRYAIWGRLIAQQPEQIGYSIIDSKVTTQFMPSVFPPIKADSIAELAGLLEIDATTLENTIAEFNAAVGTGQYDPTVLDECHTNNLEPPKTHWALPLDTPPYHAYPLRPGITFTYLGVAINEHAQVLKEDGEPSENIYAAGEIMAGNILGKGYCAGTGMTIGGVFGRIAGEHAACQ